jgi:hypothetical protein
MTTFLQSKNVSSVHIQILQLINYKAYRANSYYYGELLETNPIKNSYPQYIEKFW